VCDINARDVDKIHFFLKLYWPVTSKSVFTDVYITKVWKLAHSHLWSAVRAYNNL